VSRVRAAPREAAGTLIRPREPVGETYARVARAHGVDLPGWRLDEAFRRVLAGAPPMVFPGEAPEAMRRKERAWWREVVRRTFKAADQTARPDDFEALFDALFARFATADAWTAAPGAAHALAKLRAEGRRLAVASNFDHRLEGILQDLDLLAFFELVWTPAEAGAAKPDPAFFRGALARLGAAAAHAAHVGDDAEQDAAAARRAGLRTVVVDPAATLRDLPARIRALERTETP